MSSKKFLIAALLTAGLTACGTPGTNTSLYSVHQPVVERTNYSIDLDASGAELSSVETNRLTQWFDALELRYGDRVSIDYGNGYANAAVNQRVARLAAERGIIVAQTAPITAGAITAGTARVVVTRSKASVPSCPNWSTDTDTNDNAANHSNYGCSVNSNLAAMIADPEDLVRGRRAETLDDNEGSAAVNTRRAKRTGGN